MVRMNVLQEEMSKSIVAIEKDLKYHIKRTDLLESHIQLLEDKISKPFDWKTFAIKISIISTVLGIVVKIISITP